MMEIRFNVAGERRRALVDAIAGIAGCAPIYRKAPTFAYVVRNYTIGKNGELSFDERVDMDEARNLFAALAERGFVMEDTLEEDAVPDALAESVPEESSVGDEPGRLSIEVPLEGFNSDALDNLEKLVASKAGLIKKAVGADDLAVIHKSDRLCFPWFPTDATGEEAASYTQFIHALCELAMKQKRVTAKENHADNEKFAFRCFLLRLGFIGQKYALARKTLLAKLSGNGSFKSGKRKEIAPTI